MTLTKRQTMILNIIEEYMVQNAESPTLPEIMSESGISTKKGVAFHLDALERKGFISRTGQERGIRLLSDNSGDFIRVPCLGFANAGEPLITATEEFIGELLVDRKLLSSNKKVFGIELRGDSMDRKRLNGVALDNGNYVIVAKDTAVSPGDVVLAIINDGATVKQYEQQGDSIILMPCSSNNIHKPIYIHKDRDTILGRVITALNNPYVERNLA